MVRYLAGVLTVIAVGVLLIAYGLINPRTAVADAAMPRAMDASDRVTVLPGPAEYAARQLAYPGYAAYPADARAIRTAQTYEPYPAPAPRRVSRPVSYQTERPAPVVRRDGRDWKKTAMVIGGSTAAGAGLGAIFGGRKGALIGAAIGGGAGTVYEVRR
jgi:hypothetical protein